MPEEKPPCSAPGSETFDFWLGEWDVTWGEDGRGTNTITRKYNGCVIYEDFDATLTIPLRGMSVSVYSARLNRWRQTWVDSEGGYLDFVGGFDGERMILSRQEEIDGKLIHQRMVWYDIRQDALEWNWERSEDGGQLWTVAWNIHYHRR